MEALTQKTPSLQTHHVYSTLKRHGNGRFHVVSTWNTRGTLVRFSQSLLISSMQNMVNGGSML